MYKRSILLIALLMIGLVFAQTVPVSTTTTSGNDPSSPSIKVTGGGKTKLYVDATDSFNCRTGELNITVPDGIIGGKIGLVDETWPYEDMVLKPIDGNLTKFTLVSSGTYSLAQYDFPSYVQLNEFRKTYTLCPAEEISSPVTEIPTVPAENKSTGQSVTQEPTKPSITKQDADSEIALAIAAITVASGNGKDVSAAQAKLVEANVVLSTKDYAQAKQLAEEALELAKDAKAKAAAPATPTKPAASAPSSTKPSGPDVWAFVLVIAAIFVVLLVYMVLSERNANKNEKKGKKK